MFNKLTHVSLTFDIVPGVLQLVSNLCCVAEHNDCHGAFQDPNGIFDAVQGMQSLQNLCLFYCYDHAIIPSVLPALRAASGRNLELNICVFEDPDLEAELVCIMQQWQVEVAEQADGPFKHVRLIVEGE